MTKPAEAGSNTSVAWWGKQVGLFFLAAALGSLLFFVWHYVSGSGPFLITSSEPAAQTKKEQDRKNKPGRDEALTDTPNDSDIIRASVPETVYSNSWFGSHFGLKPVTSEKTGEKFAGCRVKNVHRYHSLGLQEGDLICSYNGYRMNGWKSALHFAKRIDEERPATITIRRNKEKKKIVLSFK